MIRIRPGDVVCPWERSTFLDGELDTVIPARDVKRPESGNPYQSLSQY